MCSHEASLRCVYEYAGSDALIGGMPCHRVGICRAGEAQAVHPALHLVERGCLGVGGGNSSPFGDFGRRGTFVEVSMTAEEEIGGGGRRGRRYCCQAVACD